MRFYRIADSRHSPETGEGARLHGGRWNSPGRAVIYACETMTGAMLEKLVHTNGRMPKHQVGVTYEAPNALKAIADRTGSGSRLEQARHDRKPRGG